MKIIKLKCSFKRCISRTIQHFLYITFSTSLPPHHFLHITSSCSSCSRWLTTVGFKLSIIFLCHQFFIFKPFSLHFPPPPLPPPSAAWPPPTRSCSQASNGPSSGYAYSLPSTPVVGHRDQGGGSVTSRSLKNIPRRPSLFKVSCWRLSHLLVSSLTIISLPSATSLVSLLLL